jgi:hypothetical protein
MAEDPKIPPTRYEIQISGRLSPKRAEWFGDMALSVKHTAQGAAITVLRGPVIDRAALFGVLNRIRDLGLGLISVNPIGADPEDAEAVVRQEEEK